MKHKSSAVAPLVPSPVPDEKTWRKIQMLTMFSGIRHMGEIVLDMFSGNMATRFMKANGFKRMSPKRMEQFTEYRNSVIKHQLKKVYADFLVICAKEKVVVTEQVAKEFQEHIDKMVPPEAFIKIPKP